MTKIAHCCCGSLRAEVGGEPAFVAACHCLECQRRTGSPFGVSAFFPKDQVRIEGPNKVYDRSSDSGRKVEFHFCPACGSTVFWYPAFIPEFIAIAFGAFADQSMPWPMLSAWEAEGHPWVAFDHELDHRRRQDD
ncbi:GFA family protein [Bradyrhizobium sp. Ai1a-2]|uniref:GFA family protein n=1 Tax=Bradyrhizobium sp. Ai1a-2 TaxID=196490 RepID=UPI00048101C3|nr:GFA family protein [Bradyrhizobium sp. Ai1a-2]